MSGLTESDARRIYREEFEAERRRKEWWADAHRSPSSEFAATVSASVLRRAKLFADTFSAPAPQQSSQKANYGRAQSRASRRGAT